MVGLPIGFRKQVTFATKWIIKLLRDKFRRVILSDIIDLLISSIYESGIAIDKKNQIYVEANINRYILNILDKIIV